MNHAIDCLSLHYTSMISARVTFEPFLFLFLLWFSEILGPFLIKTIIPLVLVRCEMIRGTFRLDYKFEIEFEFNF